MEDEDVLRAFYGGKVKIVLLTIVAEIRVDIIAYPLTLRNWQGYYLS